MRTLVAGPPCGGKTTYVTEHAQHGEQIVDFDDMLRIKGYGYGEAPSHVVSQVYQDWLRMQQVAPWVIWNAPKRWQRGQFRRNGGRSIVVMASEAECLARAEAERPPAWQGYIRGWFRAYEPSRSHGDLIVWTGVSQPSCW